jgi:DeoR/GlpR family transcriptional regulator of sugar metabolism
MVFKELCSKTKINTSDIAEKWSVSIRTAKRDLSLLQEND